MLKIAPIAALLSLIMAPVYAQEWPEARLEGAGHGFMRAGEDPANTVPGNKTARDEAFARLVKLLKGM